MQQEASHVFPDMGGRDTTFFHALVSSVMEAVSKGKICVFL